MQLMNASFIVLLLVYMQKEGYTDYEGARYFKYRFLGVLALSFPFGMFIKGRRLRPFFFIGTIGVPLFSFVTIEAVHNHWDDVLLISQVLWGLCFMSMQVSLLPYILRNVKKEAQTEAISLSFATWSAAGIVSGVVIFGLNNLNPGLFDERLILYLLSGVSLLGSLYIVKMGRNEVVPDEKRSLDPRKFDWVLVVKAMVPTIIIAVGAGLTIPFISIFFLNVHGVDTNAFPLLSAVSLVGVFGFVLLVPAIKRKLGYRMAIPATQGIAILILVGLASTELFAHHPYAVYIAVLFFLIRQPFMALAGPMTSEITMNYVGPKNQEIMSALTAAIWSGSWYFSSMVFEVLRESGMDYVNIFLITAGLYTVGVVNYYVLIVDYDKRKAKGLAE